METVHTIKLRKSVRQYSDKPIDKETLRLLVDAARLAPTGRGVEPWEFVIVQDEEKLASIANIAPNGSFVKGAGALIAVFCKETKYYIEDGCAATENILLAATDSGIGSCWIAGDKKDYCEEIGSILGVPSHFKLVSMISLGYPEIVDESPGNRQKRPLNEVIHWECF